MEDNEIKEKQDKINKNAENIKNIGCLIICDKCASMHHEICKLVEIRNSIPVHSQCRCTFVPIVK
jgi:hypothetical protein